MSVSLAHWYQDTVTAGYESSSEVGKAIARLQLGQTGILAVIHDEQGKGSITRWQEQRCFHFKSKLRACRNPNDLLAEIGVQKGGARERSLAGEHQDEEASEDKEKVSRFLHALQESKGSVTFISICLV